MTSTPSLSTTPGSGRTPPSITRPKRKPSVPISPLFPGSPHSAQGKRSLTTTLILVAVTFLLFLQWSVYGGRGERLGERVDVGLGMGHGGVGGNGGGERGVVHVVLFEFRVGVELEVIEFVSSSSLSSHVSFFLCVLVCVLGGIPEAVRGWLVGKWTCECEGSGS